MNPANPERCSRKRGARPSRSLCSASRRTDGAADSTHRKARQGDCCQNAGGTPTAAVETTALPICNCMVPAQAANTTFLNGPLVRGRDYATVNGPSNKVRLMTSVFAWCGPCFTPFGAKKNAPVV